jgi:SAM-dependent methyltransferase
MSARRSGHAACFHRLETLNLLEIRATDRVLDMGCGSGTGVRDAASRANRGYVTGLDVSQLMVDAARRRNRLAVRNGQVDFACVTDGELGLASQSFDRIYSVHCIYFWRDPAETLRQLGAALRPGGRLPSSGWSPSAKRPAALRPRARTSRAGDPSPLRYRTRDASHRDARRTGPDAGARARHVSRPCPRQ